jgi:putative FmdB family regulatory protein
MPLYEYACDACGQRFELIQKFSDPTPETCAKCGKGPVHRQLSSPAIQFKGSGWYITDYAQKGKSGTESAGSGSSSDKKTETKSETATKSDTTTTSTSSTTTSKD